MIKLNPKYDLPIVAGIALVVRLIYGIELSATPMFISPIVDAEYHDAWAREILQQGPGHEGVFFRAPLYPYFLALIYQFTEGSYWAPRLVQSLLGAATATLTYLLGRAITGRRSVAFMAGLGAALYGILVYHDGELLVETLFIPLMLAACLVWTKVRRSGSAPAVLGAGIILGLAAITRPNALILLPILTADLLLAKYGTFKDILQPRRLVHVFALLTGFFLPVFPVTWHNLEKGGDFVLICNPDGINFYIGNNPYSDGMHAMIPGLGSNWDVPGASNEAYKAEGRILKPSEVSAYYSRQAWKFIKENHYQAARLFLKKFGLFWNKLEISDNRDLYFFQNETRILPILRLMGFWLVGPLSLLGWWIGWRRKIFPGWFLALIPVYMAGVIAFFITARYRAPLLPFLLICAALALDELMTQRKPFWDRQRIQYVIALAVLGLFVNTNLWSAQRENPAHSHFCLGRSYMKLNQLEEARLSFENALKSDSLYHRTHLNLGVIRYMAHDTSGAEQEYRRELQVNPREARAYNNLAVLRFELGEFPEASELYEKALELEPYYEDARLNLAQSRFQEGLDAATQGNIGKAGELFDQAVILDGDKAVYRYNYALALGRLGYAAAAQEQLEITLRLAPGMQVARDLLEKLKELSSTGGDSLPKP